jgi:hypothetical protein
MLTASISGFAPLQKKALNQLKFPKELDVKVDVKALRSKPGWAVIKEWVAKRVTQILNGLEEEVLISLVINLLESDEVRGQGVWQTSGSGQYCFRDSRESAIHGMH